MTATISREIVGIYAEYFGRGPTKAKTTWREELLVCILKDVFTRAVDAERDQNLTARRNALNERIKRLNGFQDELRAA